MRAPALVVERLFPAEISLHGRAAALVGLQHHVVGLVGEACGSGFDGASRRLPRAHPAREDTGLRVAETRQRRRGEGRLRAVGARHHQRLASVGRDRADLLLEPAPADPRRPRHVRRSVHVTGIDADDHRRPR